MRVSCERWPGNGLGLNVHRFSAGAPGPRADQQSSGETSSGATLLVLHGFLDAGGTWELVAEPLCALGHQVLAPDLRGFGASDRVSGGGYYHFPDYVADVDALVRALELPPVVLIGHSMGGTVASLYAGARPERVRGLVLLEGIGPPVLPPETALARMQSWLAELATPRPNERAVMAGVEAAVARLAHHHPGVDRATLASRVPHLTTPLDGGRLRWAHDALHRTTAPSLFQLDTFKVFLGAIRCPVLVLSGGESGWQPPDAEERIAAIGGPVERAAFEGAGHMLHWTRPREVAEAIARFTAALTR